MITISNQLQLKAITINDQAHLIKLMRAIYPPVYKHLWINEDCNWYLDSQYDRLPLQNDLNNLNANYYFLMTNTKRIGVFRVIWDYTHKEAKNSKAVKLHRIYIDPNFHNHGFGKQALHWVINKAKKENYDLIWLEVMDSQKQALKFYNHLGFKSIFNMRLPFERIHKTLRGMHTMELSL